MWGQRGNPGQGGEKPWVSPEPLPSIHSVADQNFGSRSGFVPSKTFLRNKTPPRIRLVPLKTFIRNQIV